jgi:hypothetical protein
LNPVEQARKTAGFEENQTNTLINAIRKIYNKEVGDATLTLSRLFQN